MPGILFILSIVLLGALFGFFFSRKGHEKEGAIQGAKGCCGCLLGLTLLLIVGYIILILFLGGAF